MVVARKTTVARVSNTPLDSLGDEAYGLIQGDRRQDYGGALDSFMKIAQGWSIILGKKVTPEQVCLCMDWLKTCRYVAGGQRDSLVDKIGYTALMEVIDGERTNKRRA